MSGKAVDWPVVRVTTEEFEDVKARIAAHLFDKCAYRFPTPLTGKTSHGDVDVLVDEQAWGFTELPGFVRGVNRRNGFTHCAWPLPDGRYVQADFITVPADCLDMARLYYSHGTLSNHIGMLCRSIGLRFSHHGLLRTVHDPATGTSVGNVCITRKRVKALYLLGLPAASTYTLINKSFATREDSYPLLFDFPFFTARAFDLERMSAANRIRERKRPETGNLIEWLDKYPGPIPRYTLPAKEDAAACRVYEQAWQETLLSPRLSTTELARLDAEAAQLVQETRERARRSNEHAGWFAEFGGLVGGDPAVLGRVVGDLARAAGLKVPEYVRDVTPRDAARHYEGCGESATQIQ